MNSPVSLLRLPRRSPFALLPIATCPSLPSSPHFSRILSPTPHLRPRPLARSHNQSSSLYHPLHRTFSTSPLHRALTESPAPSSSSQPPSSSDDPPPPGRRDVPAYEITFTCKPCSTRATHKISKQGYHKGTVLIMCPNCKARHLISDHLKIFEDKSTTIEDILRQKGDVLKKGTLGDQGDMEFWEDGSVTTREEGKGKKSGKEGGETDMKQLS